MSLIRRNQCYDYPVTVIYTMAAYPIYVKITKKRRERLAPQIKKLSEELLQQNGRQ